MTMQVFANSQFTFVPAVFVSLRSILMVELIGLNSLSNEFGLVTMCQGLSAFIGAPIAGEYAHAHHIHAHPYTRTLSRIRQS